MPTESQSNNNRIAKNTVFLYIRMFIIMAINLYTSRLLLEALGVTDYGVYNVVGGIVTMFGFLNGAMTTTTQRYITFELGRNGDRSVSLIFSTSLEIHYLIAVIVLLLGETIGLWFFEYEMEIPQESRVGAMWVLQCSILASMTMIISVPYNALIIAHEKMSIFAYLSVVEAVLKLLIIYVIIILPFDRLKFYAILILCVQLLMRMLYLMYCRRNYTESKFHWVFDKPLFKEMLGFAGWNLWGNCAAALYNQGLNLLLNVFFGPVVNAARAIAVQVENAILQFSQNFQIAIFPQITKTYAQGKLDEMHSLLIRGSKLSFFLLTMISLPVVMEANIILKLWLKTVPDYTEIFLFYIILSSTIDAMARPLMQGAAATGDIKSYQAIIGGILLSVVPIAYIVLKLGGPPQSVFVVLLAVIIVAFVVRLYILRPMIQLPVGRFFNDVVLRAMLTVCCCLPLPMAVKLMLPDSILASFAVMVVSVISVMTIGFAVCFNRQEKAVVLSKFKGVIDKFARR